MFRQVVVGVEEDKGSRDAIAIARKLLAGDGAFTLAHVYTRHPHVYRGVSPTHESSERERALELLERTREEGGVPANLRVPVAHSVGRGLHELCEEIGADPRAALTGARGAIAIAPAGYVAEPATMREIGVGYDGSPESEHALGLARNLALELGAELSAFEAITLPSTALSTGPLPFDEMVTTLVTEARDRIAAFGDVEPHAAYGHPAEELAVYSASLDLLVTGSRGYGPIGRLIHGSTSQELARRARCPLLVLPRLATATEPLEVVEPGRETAAEVRG